MSETINYGAIMGAANKLLEAIDFDNDPQTFAAFQRDPVATLASFGADMPPLTPELATAYQKYLAGVAESMGSQAQVKRGPWRGGENSVACWACELGMYAVIMAAIAACAVAVIGTDGLAAPAIITAVVGVTGLSTGAAIALLTGLGTGSVAAATAAVEAAVSGICHAIPNTCSSSDNPPPPVGSNQALWTNWRPIAATVHTTAWGGTVTAVYRDPSQLDLFTAGTDGTVWNITWTGLAGWASGWAAIRPSYRTTPGGPVTAVYRSETHLDLFMAGTDGTVWNIAWDQGAGWQADWSSIQSKYRTTPGGPVTAIYRDPTHLDLFMAGTDGTIWTISWNQLTGWQGWWSAVQSKYRTTAGGHVTAVYRDPLHPTHLDLFMAGTDGTVWNISREASGWQAEWSAIQPKFRTTAGGPVAAICRDPTHLDLFMAGTDGTIWNISWNQSTGWQGSWYAVQSKYRTTAGGHVTAVYRDPTHLDLFMAGTDGTVWNISWNQGTGWQAEWSAIYSDVRSNPGSPVTAVWGDPTQANLFIANPAGIVFNTKTIS